LLLALPLVVALFGSVQKVLGSGKFVFGGWSAPALPLPAEAPPSFITTSDEQQATSDERRATSDERRATSDERRATNNKQQTTNNKQ